MCVSQARGWERGLEGIKKKIYERIEHIHSEFQHRMSLHFPSLHSPWTLRVLCVQNVDWRHIYADIIEIPAPVPMSLYHNTEESGFITVVIFVFETASLEENCDPGDCDHSAGRMSQWEVIQQENNP